MILFKNDWKKYPNAIVHINTKNKSFVRQAGLIKSMGVANHAFLLALLDPSLEHVDPHSEDLTNEEIFKIVVEAKNNPWYIFREIIRIPVNGSTVPVKLEANRGNISMFWSFFNHVTTLLIQPRQTGKSVSVDSLMVALLNILCYKTQTHLFTKDDGLRAKNIDRLKSMQAELPYYLYLKTRQDANNTEAITVKALKNEYVTSLPQASKKDALKVGRGYTIAIHQVDEIAYVNNVAISLPALLTSSSAAIDNAKVNNTPYGFVFTTTAGHLSSESGRYVYDEIYSKHLRWTEHLYDCEDMEHLHATIRKNNPSGRLGLLLEFNHRQLGKTDAWLLEKLELAFSQGEDAEADYLNKWATGNAQSAIPKKYLDIIEASRVLDPYITMSKQGYITRWYVPKNEVIAKLKGRDLIMGLDTSEANGGDDITMNIRDSGTGEVIASGNYNELNTIVFSEWVAEWLIEYPNLTLVIERKSTGSSMLENLLLILPKHNLDPFRRIFNWVVDEQHVNDEFKKALAIPMHQRDMLFYNKYKKYFGYATSGAGKQSRENLYGKVLNSSLRYTSNYVRDSLTIHQLGMLKKENGRIDHAKGEHDDSVIAWLLNFWFLLEAKNKAYYGIDTRYVLSIINTVDTYLAGGNEAIKNRENNLIIRKEINRLEELSERATTEFERIRIQSKIKQWSKQLVDEEDNKLNQDTLIMDAKSYLNVTKQKPYGNLYSLENNPLTNLLAG